MMNTSLNSSYVRDNSGITRDRLKLLLQQSSQRQLINRDQQLTRKWILFSAIFLCLVQMIVPNSFLHFREHIWNAKRFIIVGCAIYTIRLIYRYFKLLFSNYVFMTKTEFKQLGLATTETGFIICDNPTSAETAYNRHLHLNRILCWISPQSLNSIILNKQQTSNSALPLRTLTSTLADQISSLVQNRPLSSPKKFDSQKDFYESHNSIITTPDPLAALRNSVYWQSSPESPSTNMSDCSRFLTELDREAFDLSTSHNRSLNDSLCRSPIIGTNAMNDTVAELRSRPYQMAHTRLATSHNGSTVVDEDARKSDYKRLTNGSSALSGISSTGGLTNSLKWRRARADGPQSIVLRENMRKWLTKTILTPLCQKVDRVNQTLVALGHTDIVIGKTTPSELKSFIRTCSNQSLVDELNQILANFEVHPNQEYVLSRLQILARSYMADYKWKSGVITDAELVFNFFCAFFDRHLPPDPRLLDGKVFRGNYVVRQAQLTNTNRFLTALYVYQEKPPIYKVVSNGEIYDVPDGDHNLYDALALFVECLSTNRNGHLGPLNLGPSGVNILWTITSATS